jgi:hypothetical protein
MNINLPIWLWLFLITVIVKFILNLSRYLKCKEYLSKYKKYLKDPKWEFAQHQPSIVSLFKMAGIEDSSILVIEPVPGNVMKTQTSLFLNIITRRPDIIDTVRLNFQRAIGTYRSRMFEALNPLYWLETIIYLPQRVFSYLGVSPESTITKIVQLSYWLISIGGGLLYAVIEDQLLISLKDWLIKLLQ